MKWGLNCDVLFEIKFWAVVEYHEFLTAVVGPVLPTGDVSLQSAEHNLCV